MKTIEIHLTDGSFIVVPRAHTDTEALAQIKTPNITDASRLQLKFVYSDLLYGDVSFTDVIVRKKARLY